MSAVEADAPPHIARHESSSPSPADQDVEKGPATAEDGQPEDEDRPGLYHVPSHLSNHEMQGAASHGFKEENAAQYLKFSPRRKVIITIVVSICSFLAPVSSTTILSAIPEVAAQYNTTGTIINISNALYLVFMGLSPGFYGPLSAVYGRRWICLICSSLFFAFSIGTALAPNLPAYFIFRMLTAFQGTSFLVVGSYVLGDIYTPTERATAMGWFLSGTLIGPAFGPFIGGVIVTFRSWRDVFWFQTALGGFAVIAVIFFLPETIPAMKKDDFVGLSKVQVARRLAGHVNPARPIKLMFSYPNLIIAGMGTSALVWNMYSLLTPIRYVLNPRFNLTSPIQSGLFYIAPGCGYLLGTFVGGRWADRTVKKWINKRGNRRVPEDRLRSCLPFIGLIIPGCMVVYGWSVEKAKGGIPVPVLAMFLQGVAQLFCFPSLNTYCLDVMQSKGRSADVVASNYMLRYIFAAAGSAVVLPAIEGIGVGWFSTISALFLAVVSIGIFFTSRRGEQWRDAVEAKQKAKTDGLQQDEKEAEKEKEEEKVQESAGPMFSSPANAAVTGGTNS